LPPSFEPPARARPLTPLCPCLFQFDGFDERGQRRASRAHRGGGAAGCNLVFRPIGIAARLQSTTSGSRASLELSQTTNAPARFRRCPSRLTNRFFPKDCCTLPNQMSFLLAHSWSAFVLAKGDRHGANKNEIASFVFSVTTKGFSHARAPGWKRGDPLRVGSLASALVGVNPVFRVRPSRKLHSREQDLTAYKSSRVSWLGRFRRVY
jgi:hypothetical protein